MKQQTKAPAYPVNQRFCALCLALEIVPKDEGTEESYEVLRRKVRALIESQCVLRDGSLHISKPHHQGPGHSLRGELTGDGPKGGLLDEMVATAAVRRLLGFVRHGDEDEKNSVQRWTLLSRDTSHHGSGRLDATAEHQSSYAVVPDRIRDRIRAVWEAAPGALNEYARKATNYLAYGSDRGHPLPMPPWLEPYEFDSGHDFILEFFDCVEAAKHSVTVAAVNSYITASIGRQLFMNAFDRNVQVRFLIFDFLHGDVKEVARMIRRSEEAFYALASDTVEALLKLQERAAAAGKAHLLELRLLDKDPEGRWYIVDAEPDGSPRGFVVLRAVERKSADAAGDRVSVVDVLRHAEVVERLWAGARHLDEIWLAEYRAWKADPDTQCMLGQR